MESGERRRLYEVYDRAVRTHEWSAEEDSAAGASASSTTQQHKRNRGGAERKETHREATTRGEVLAVEGGEGSSAVTVAVFDALAGEVLFFSVLDDYAKPTKVIASASEGDPFASAFPGRNSLVAVTASGACSLIDTEGNVDPLPSVQGGHDVVFLYPNCATSPSDAEVLAVRANAVVEVHSKSGSSPRGGARKAVNASKFHNSVTQACLSRSSGGLLCLAGGDGSLESISLWNFANGDDELRSLSSRPFAHFGLGQTRVQRYVLNTLDKVQSSWKGLLQMKARGTGNATLVASKAKWKINLSPLGERIAVKSPERVHLFQVEGGSAIKPMDTAGLLGSLGSKTTEQDCRECLWWSESRLLCNVSDTKLLVLQTKDRNVLFEHSFECESPFGMYPLSSAKAMVLRALESESESGWQLACVAQRTPEEMLHSYLAKSKFEEAKQVAKVFQLDAGMVYKRQWLQSQATVSAIEKMLLRVEDKMWVIEQCIATIGEDFDTQKYLLDYGLEQISLILASDKYSKEQKEDLKRMKIRFLRHEDCLQTSLALFDQTYFAEVYSELRNHDIVGAACLFAQTANVDSLQILLQRHPCFLLPNILSILSCFPESMDVNLYRSIFNSVTPGSIASPRQDDDCETREEVSRMGMLEALEEGGAGILCKVTDNVYSHANACKSPPVEVVRTWVTERLLDLVNSGYFQNARNLVDAVSSLTLPVVSKEVSAVFGSTMGFMDAVEIGLIRFDMDARNFLHADNLAKLRILLELSTNETIARDMRKALLPFLDSLVCDQKSKEDLLLQFTQEEFGARPVWVINFLSNLCVYVTQDLKLERAPFVKRAVEMLAAKPNMGDWDVVSGSLSSLLGSLGQEEEESIVVSIKNLCNRVQSARLLEKHGLKLDLATLEEYSKDKRNERTLLRKLLSKAAQQRRQSDKMWDHLWNDACIVCELVFRSSDCEQILAEFCRVLLQTGQFLIADRFLDGKDGVQLTQPVAEKVVLATGKDLFYSAKSFSSPEVSKAKQCFLIIPESKVIREELDYISSLENVHRFGLGLRPCDVKSISEKTDIFDMILKHDQNSYSNVSALIKFADSLHLDSKEDHLQIKLKLAKTGFELGDAGFALDLVGLFIDENFVPAADLVISIIRGLDASQVENEFMAEMTTFAMCYSQEKDLDFLVKNLKGCVTSRNRAINAGSILRENEFWVNKTCSALSSLVEFDQMDSLLDYVKDVVVGIDNYVQVDRILSTLLAALSVKAGVVATNSLTNAFAFHSPKETKALLLESLASAEPQMAESIQNVTRWLDLLERAGKVLEHVNKFKVGLFVAGAEADKEGALLQAVCNITEQGSENVIERALQTIFDVAEDAELHLGKIMKEFVSKIFASGKCNACISLSICTLLEGFNLAEDALGELSMSFTTEVYAGLRGTDTFNILYIFNVLECCLSLSSVKLVGDLEGIGLDDLKKLKDVLALILWVEEDVDFKSIITGEEKLFAEMKMYISRTNVNGFACLCECLSAAAFWQGRSKAVTTSDVYFCQLGCDMVRPEYQQEELLAIASKSLPKLCSPDLERFVSQLTSKENHFGGELQLSNLSRLGVLEAALEVAKARDGEDSQLASSFHMTLVNEKALQSMDDVLNLSPAHRALLDRSERREDLYDALGALACDGVDLCVLTFAASVYGILDADYDSLREAILAKVKDALGNAEWSTEEGVSPIVLLVRSLEAKEDACLDHLEFAASFTEFVDRLRSSAWNEIQSYIKDHKYGESASVQPIVLFLSEKFVAWKYWSQPDDEGFDHILLLCQSNEILEQYWEEGPQASKDDFRDIQALRVSFGRLLAAAEHEHHLISLHRLLACWEENWKPNEDIVELRECHLNLLVKCVEAGKEFALKVLVGMQERDHPAVSDQGESETFFKSLIGRAAGADTELLGPVLFKCALLVPHKSVHDEAFRLMEASPGIALDVDIVGLLAHRGLVPRLCVSSVLVGEAVQVLSSLSADPGCEAIKHLVAPHVVAELCVTQKYQEASDLVCRFLRTQSSLITKDVAVHFLERYLRAVERGGAGRRDFRISHLEEVAFEISGDSFPADHFARAIGELAKCW